MFLGYMYVLVDLSFVLAVSDVSIRVVFVCWVCYLMVCLSLCISDMLSVCCLLAFSSLCIVCGA